MDGMAVVSTPQRIAAGYVFPAAAMMQQLDHIVRAGGEDCPVWVHPA